MRRMKNAETRPVRSTGTGNSLYWFTCPNYRHKLLSLVYIEKELDSSRWATRTLVMDMQFKPQKVLSYYLSVHVTVQYATLSLFLVKQSLILSFVISISQLIFHNSQHKV